MAKKKSPINSPKRTRNTKSTRSSSTSKKVASTRKKSSLKIQMEKVGFNTSFSERKINTSIKKIIGTKTKKISISEERQKSLRQLKPSMKRFHGIKLSKHYFPSFFWRSKCKNTFCYLTPNSVRNKSKLPFNQNSIGLLIQLGAMMGNPNRDTGADSNIPAGYTYFGQFVDHDITFDVSSSLDSPQLAGTIENMRTPKLDLDNVYGNGPGLDPFLYNFPNSGSAIKMQLGANTNTGPGGPSSTNVSSGMQTLSDFDVPRVSGSLTAVIGDPRNDENLIVSQFQHAMLKFHNRIVDMLVIGGFSGDIFLEAKRIVTHHYQWVVVNDFLVRICGVTAVKSALKKVKKTSKMCMPVEFSVAAYRFGHSMIRNNYWVNFNFPNASLGQVFEFVRNPRLPVFSNWVVDFNAFVHTGKSVPVFNNARKIDSLLANGLENLPGTPPGLLGILAARNLKRGLAFGLPSGQAVAKYFGIAPMSSTSIKSGLPADEKALLDAQGGLLLKKTPLWYYILREAKVKKSGNQLGPVGAKIVADTFVKILKSDPDSYLNHSGGFTPSLPATGTFDLADIIKLSGVNIP